MTFAKARNSAMKISPSHLAAHVAKTSVASFERGNVRMLNMRFSEANIINELLYAPDLRILLA
jgi:hypothetical protein